MKSNKNRSIVIVFISILIIISFFSAKSFAQNNIADSKDFDAEISSQGSFTSIGQLNGHKIGVQTGSSFDEQILAALPKAEIEFYNTKADLVKALTTNKIDGFVVDEPVAKIIINEIDGITYISEYLDSFDFGYVFPKDDEGQKLCNELNEFLKQLKESDEYDKLSEKWFSDDEDIKVMPDISSLDPKNGTIRMGTESGYAPFEYMRDGQIVGYDIDIAIRFCAAYGYGLDIIDMNYDAILPSIQSGKCNFAGAGIAITPERAESVLFSDPNFSGGSVMMVRSNVSSANNDGILASIEKTFIKESRWKLFLSGVCTTLHITIFSIIFGTALGFGIYMLYRKNNPIIRSLSDLFLWLVQGMPIVVLFMILYYVIFGSLSISGTIVSIIGFTMTFGSAVFGMIQMGIGTIDKGQYEAAYALGHTELNTFFRIIFPQAIPHILPVYKGEIISLIKSTSIVGYIAVQDLTKIGDIIRSRTYEAFFPLIAITIIYFLLEGTFNLIIRVLSNRVDPKNRSKKEILKGVNIHD